MASGEAEPLQYTTTALRVSIHCEGCKKKVKKVLHGIEGVYKVTVDAPQHKVTVTGSVGADALIRRLNKAGKMAALWPAPPAPAAKNKKPEGGAADSEPAVVVADKAEAKLQEKGEEKADEAAEGSVKKKDKEQEKLDKDSSDKKPEKIEADKQKNNSNKKRDSEADDAKEKTKGVVPEQPAKEEGVSADQETSGAEENSAKMKGGKKKKNTAKKDAGGGGSGSEGKEEATAATEKKPPPPYSQPVIVPSPPQFPGPERPHGSGFPYYAPPHPHPHPVMSYNVAHPSASLSYYAPAPAVPFHPPPAQQQHVPYGYPPYPHMMPPPPMEYLYGPPGMRSSSPPRESYNDDVFSEENAGSCSLM